MSKRTTRYPFTRYRPVKTDTGGGSSEVLASPVTIWSEMEISEEAPEIVIDVNEDVKVEDVIVFEETIT